MRRISNLSVPNYAEKTVAISDFSSITKCAYNVTPTDNGLKQQRLTAEKVFDAPPSKLVKLYYVNDTLFAYCENNMLYYRNGRSWLQVIDLIQIPLLSKINVNGEWKTLISTLNERLIFNGASTERVNLPYGDAYETFKYRLFVANDNSLAFSLVGNAVDFGERAINTDQAYGKIIGLFAQKTRLVVACERAIYHLLVNNSTSGFSLVKQDLDVDLVKGKITMLDGNLYFVNRGEFCVYDGTDVKKVQTQNDLSGYSFESEINCLTGAVYVVCGKNSEQKKLLLLDTINGSDKFLPFNNLTTNGGYIVNEDGVYKLTHQTENVQALWESVLLDLSSPYKKALTKFSVRANGVVEGEIIGTYQTKKFRFACGGAVTLNMPSYAYKVVLKLGANTTVQNIKFVYRIKEN